MLSWLKNRKWKKSKTITDSELTVIKVLLPDNDDRTEKLLEQVQNAPYFLREVIENGYMLTIPYITCDPVDIDETVSSKELVVRDEITSKELTFRIQVLRGGFLNNFTVTMQGNEQWTRDWSVSCDNLKKAKSDVNWLPKEMNADERKEILNKLAKNYQMNISKLFKYPKSDLCVYPPASENGFSNIEAQEGLKIPEAYKDFLMITNGIMLCGGMRPYDILGTKDLYTIRFEIDNNLYWVITNLQEDGVVVIKEERAVLMTYLVKPHSEEMEIAGTIGEYLLDSLELLDQVNLNESFFDK